MSVIMNILNSKKTETAIQINDEFSHDVFYLDLLTASTESKGERREIIEELKTPAGELM